MFGTCAGLILLAKEVVGDDSPHLGLMDVVVERHTFGRQVDSFEVELSIHGLGKGINLGEYAFALLFCLTILKERKLTSLNY